MVVSTTDQRRESTVDEFLAKHADKITGVLACFDRVNFKGHLGLNWP
jgi:hypothetical protein